jgi:hypothetical protein
MTQQKLDTQRDVVQNERRWSMDNQPYGSWWERLPALCFPPSHPFHHSLIGSMSDLDAASLEDIEQFFTTYYTPDNAVLSIAGDFDPREAARLVERHFGPIPAARASRPAGHDAAADAWRAVARRWCRTTWCCHALSRVSLAVFGSDEYYAASVCGAILGLQEGKPTASPARARAADRRRGAVVHVRSHARGAICSCSTSRPARRRHRGSSSARCNEEVDRCATRASRGEVARARDAHRDRADRRAAIGGDRADKLSLFATYFGDPSLVNTQAARIATSRRKRSTRSRAHARRGQSREPAVRAARHARSTPRTRSSPRRGTMTVRRRRRVGRRRDRPDRAAQLSLSRIQRRTLPNGMRLVVAPVTKLPLVSITAVIDAGASVGAGRQDGVAR